MNILPAELDKGQICSRPLTSTPSSPLLATAKLTSLETSFKNGHLHMLSRCEQQIVLCGKKNSDNPSFSVKTPHSEDFKLTTFTNSTDWDSHIKHFCFIFPLSYCW